MRLEGRQATVIGLGLSGLAAVRLLLRERARVRATDRRPAAKLGPAAADLAGRGVDLFLGGHPAEAAEGSDLMVVSPGVPLDLPLLSAARSHGAEIIGEMGLAAAFLKMPMVAVSGTNGKSTTTALIAHLLAAAGKRVFVGGNIGRPLTEGVLDEPEAEVAVVEVSSFQLETMPYFRPRVAVMLNISPDHLDRYPDYMAYARSKTRLWQDLSPEDDLVLNGQDSFVRSLAAGCPARQYLFAPEIFDGPGAATIDGRAVLRDQAGRTAEVDISGWSLPGRHNRQNLLAGLLAAWLAGAEAESMAAGLAGFGALDHRLQLVRTIDGVAYYNDSKATNPLAAAEAVLGFDRPIILIAGGLAKGTGFEELVEAARGRLKTAILIGQAAEELAGLLGRFCPAHRAGEMAAAVAMAADLAAPGDVVLLSPACASFDQFDNFGHRGRVFIEAVEKL